MKTNIVIDISPQYLAKFWVLGYGPKCCKPINLQDSLNCNILLKKWMMKFVFCLQINIEVFYKVILLFWVSVTPGMPKVPKISFISLQYLHKSMRDEVDFLPADKHKSFYKMIVSLMVCIARHFQSIQNNMFTISLQ